MYRYYLLRSKLEQASGRRAEAYVSIHVSQVVLANREGLYDSPKGSIPFQKPTTVVGYDY